MNKHILFSLFAAVALLTACQKPGLEDEPVIPINPGDTISEDTVVIAPEDTSFHKVALHSALTYVQPMTGLVLWPDEAADRDADYNHSIALEFSYCLPCKVVTGKQDGQIQYDWSWFENLLNDVASRGHQAVVRFRYEYPSGDDVDGPKGATAVPAYIKELADYKETYSKNPGGDGPTYYADWSNSELLWFTKQFYTDLATRYGSDPRVAFLEVGFGHWSEYHIYGTDLKLGTNFPTKEYQREFFLHLASVMPIPWLISIDAADDEYTPFLAKPELMALQFGNFDDSFMHEGHEIGSSDGYNEENWRAMGHGTRWHNGVCGGEISYYEDSDQRNFLNPSGMYGHTWAEQAAKYHITFMIANDAPSGSYGSAARFLNAGLATGYHFKVLSAETSGKLTRLSVTNVGVAPLYKDAYFAISGVRSAVSLKGLLPGDSISVTIPASLPYGSALTIESDMILPSQHIQFEANID